MLNFLRLWWFGLDCFVFFLGWCEGGGGWVSGLGVQGFRVQFRLWVSDVVSGVAFVYACCLF